MYVPCRLPRCESIVLPLQVQRIESPARAQFKRLGLASNFLRKAVRSSTYHGFDPALISRIGTRPLLGVRIQTRPRPNHSVATHIFGVHRAAAKSV